MLSAYMALRGVWSSGSSGRTTSSPSKRSTFTVASYTPPVIANQPADVSVSAGETAVFTAAAAGEGLTYQWYYRKPGNEDWTPVSVHGTGATYTLTTKARHNGYSYYCAVSDGTATVASEVVTLTVS